MTITWEEASQSVLSLANELVREYHPELLPANILFLFRSEPSQSGGRLILGKASKVSSQMKVLLDDADFLIWLSKPDWEAKSDDLRRPLLDHLLEHCTIDEVSGNCIIRNPEINEFRSIINRHGLWSFELVRIGEVFKNLQAKLPMIDESNIERSPVGKNFTISGSQLEMLANQPMERGR